MFVQKAVRSCVS